MSLTMEEMEALQEIARKMNAVSQKFLTDMGACFGAEPGRDMTFNEFALALILEARTEDIRKRPVRVSGPYEAFALIHEANEGLMDAIRNGEGPETINGEIARVGGLALRCLLEHCDLTRFEVPPVAVAIQTDEVES